MKLPTPEELRIEWSGSPMHYSDWVHAKLKEYVSLAEEEARREALEKAITRLERRAAVFAGVDSQSHDYAFKCGILNAIDFVRDDLKASRAAPATAEAGKKREGKIKVRLHDTGPAKPMPIERYTYDPPVCEHAWPTFMIDGWDTCQKCGLRRYESAPAAPPPIQPSTLTETFDAQSEARIRELAREEAEKESQRDGGMVRACYKSALRECERLDSRIDDLQARANTAPFGKLLPNDPRDGQPWNAERLESFGRELFVQSGLAPFRSPGAEKTAETRTVGEVPFEEIKPLLSGHPLRRPPPDPELIENAYRRGWNDLLACAIDWSFTEPGEQPYALSDWIKHAQARHAKSPAARDGSAG